MQLNPYQPEARAYLKGWMGEWCRARPDTTVVRFTSLFYNFAWIWGAHLGNRYLFGDWGSYDFTVSPEALEDFARQYGYALTAEDFVGQGKYNAASSSAFFPVMRFACAPGSLLRPMKSAFILTCFRWDWGDAHLCPGRPPW